MVSSVLDESEYFSAAPIYVTSVHFQKDHRSWQVVLFGWLLGFGFVGIFFLNTNPSSSKLNILEYSVTL